MGPFYYPKTQHRRGSDPGPFTNYRQYKPALRGEFARKCVYCRCPDLGSDHTYAVEHYRPKSDARFANLKASWDNLFYACPLCNTYKGTYWPNEDHDAAGVFVPNPCDHIMFAHLRFVDFDVQAQSAAGTWTKRLLRLDADRRGRQRRMIVAAAKQLTRDLADSNRTVGALEQRLVERPQDALQLAAELEDARNIRDAVAADLSDLGG